MAVRRYRELVLDVPTGSETSLYERLTALAQQHHGPKVDFRKWVVDMLEELTTAMEQEIARQANKHNLVQLVDAGGRPQLTAGPLVINGDPS